MSGDDHQLEQARSALVRVENALAALRARVERENPAVFAAMSESYRADILKIQRDIEASASRVEAWINPVENPGGV